MRTAAPIQNYRTVFRKYNKKLRTTEPKLSEDITIHWGLTLYLSGSGKGTEISVLRQLYSELLPPTIKMKENKKEDKQDKRSR